MQAYTKSAKIETNIGNVPPISAVRHIPVLTFAQSSPPPPPHTHAQEYDVRGIVSTFP